MSHCPTPCDDDCDAVCHELHQVRSKRDPEHQHSNGDPRIDIFIEATRQHARGHLRTWLRQTDDDIAAGIAALDDLIEARGE